MELAALIPFQAEDWVELEQCPSCKTRKFQDLGALTIPFYGFGRLRLSLPPNGVRLRECLNCELVYKSTIPGIRLVSDLMTRESIWTEEHPLESDVELILQHLKTSDFDLLDVGAAHGHLLKAMKSRTSGRISALDVVQYSGLDGTLRGEFILGQIEDAQLSWSEEPYDVVIASDVVEHLYAPEDAFKNFDRLVKEGGILCIETGNSDSEWPRKYGVGRWWYASWVVHHLFWRETSLHKLAQRHAFELVATYRQKHKSRRNLPLKTILKEGLKVGLYRISPNLYDQLSRTLKLSGTQPYSPWTNDHLFMIFRKMKTEHAN